MSAYQQLTKRFGRMLTLQSIEDVLHWDTATMMPEGAAPARGEQLALLRVVQHEISSAPDMEALLGAAAGEQLADWERANLREMRRHWIHAACVPVELVEALSRARSRCEARWRSARPAANFAAVAPLLEEVVRLTREVASARAERLGTSRYEAMLDEHEPGLRCADIDRLFDDIATWLPALLGEALERQRRRGEPLPLEGPFPVALQRELGLRFMRLVGFDPERGRLDVSAHPFCGGTPDDVRITTRYDESDFASGLMAVLHETGHALYQLNLPAAWRHQPVGAPRGMGTHESQSLLVEMQACRSREFLEYAAPIIRDTFGRQGPAWDADNLYARYIRVAPGCIRVDADEVTYPAHVIMRYRLERAMLEGELEVVDLPHAWNEGMGTLLGVTPPDDRLGCLQDIHWYDGAFGYFPSYTLGAITAAQLFQSAIAEDAGILPGLSHGDFSALRGWLVERVHQHGSRFTTPELVEQATGSALDIAHYKAHLQARYV